MVQCKACHLALSAKQRVIGRGSTPSKILFIGEAPGASEDALGKPFVGPSGKLLDEMIEKAGIDMSYYITNCVQCRPPENRDPTNLEVLSCMENVLKIADEVRPEHVVFIGRIAERYYKKHFPNGVMIIHPAAILRTGGKGSPLFLDNVRKLEALCD
jgi:DNA polymerase